jgi:hypothetical protein
VGRVDQSRREWRQTPIIMKIPRVGPMVYFVRRFENRDHERPRHKQDRRRSQKAQQRPVWVGTYPPRGVIRLPYFHINLQPLWLFCRAKACLSFLAGLPSEVVFIRILSAYPLAVVRPLSRQPRPQGQDCSCPIQRLNLRLSSRTTWSWKIRPHTNLVLKGDAR